MCDVVPRRGNTTTESHRRGSQRVSFLQTRVSGPDSIDQVQQASSQHDMVLSPGDSHKAAVSVVIPTYGRPEQLLQTVGRILSCDPAPDDILVHVDAGDLVSGRRLHDAFPHVCVNHARSRQGPGGGRNRLVELARHNIVVSFDDDSWPLSPSFFRQALDLTEQYPDVAMFACEILEGDELEHAATIACRPVETLGPVQMQESAGFVGCGCIFRRSAFLKTGGYLPLERAYGMEEADVTLKLLDQGDRIALVKGLQVYHDCNRPSRHGQAKINAAHITNTALLVFLRYPPLLWPYGGLQVLNRLCYCLSQGRFSGMLRGVCAIPAALWWYRSNRKTVRSETLKLLLRIRRHPSPIERTIDD